MLRWFGCLIPSQLFSASPLCHVFFFLPVSYDGKISNSIRELSAKSILEFVSLLTFFMPSYVFALTHSHMMPTKANYSLWECIGLFKNCYH